MGQRGRLESSQDPLHDASGGPHYFSYMAGYLKVATSGVIWGALPDFTIGAGVLWSSTSARRRASQLRVSHETGTYDSSSLVATPQSHSSRTDHILLCSDPWKAQPFRPKAAPHRLPSH